MNTIGLRHLERDRRTQPAHAPAGRKAGKDHPQNERGIREDRRREEAPDSRRFLWRKGDCGKWIFFRKGKGFKRISASEDACQR